MRRLTLVFAALLTLAAARGASAAPFTVTDDGEFTSYVIDGQNNPAINLVRGQTYTFNINAPGHPFWIKTAQVTGTGSAFNTGVTGQGTQIGTLTWTVPMAAPATLFYNCQVHAPMTGVFHITSPLATPSLAPPLAAAAGLLLAGWAAFEMNRRRAQAERIS